MPATGAGIASGAVSWMVWLSMESTLSRFGTDSNFVSFFLGATMSYLAAMELQTQIDELKASLNRQKLAIIALASVIVAGVGVAAIQPAGDATFDTITCKAWKVVDKDGKSRIVAGTNVDGNVGVRWFDKIARARRRKSEVLSIGYPRGVLS